MNTYQTIALPVTNPVTGETKVLKLFGCAEFDSREWQALFATGVKLEDVFNTPFQVGAPMDFKDMAAFDGFKELVAALDTDLSGLE